MKNKETLEEVIKVERTELFNSIFSVVKQIPRKDVECDAMDASSCSYEIEQLFYKWQQEQDKNKYSEEDLISLLEFNYKKETNQLGTLRKDYSQKIVKEWFEQFKKEVI